MLLSSAFFGFHGGTIRTVLLEIVAVIELLAAAITFQFICTLHIVSFRHGVEGANSI
ncbi:MAG TPA: hypothetical protein VG456_15875 [Candidatus Sulfopaludibacter sp.]|nr:hypothetical protein [Candidatus Sulfopaludibacter sp.]